MAPINEAKQPIVIGGVVIEHTDQKVCLVLGSLRCFGFHSSSNAFFVTNLFFVGTFSSGWIRRENTPVYLILSTVYSWHKPQDHLIKLYPSAY
jgi:hypothetical protein